MRAIQALVIWLGIHWTFVLHSMLNRIKTHRGRGNSGRDLTVTKTNPKGILWRGIEGAKGDGPGKSEGGTLPISFPQCARRQIWASILP